MTYAARPRLACLLGATLLLAAPAVSSAGKLDILINDVDLTYLGSVATFADSVSMAGGSLTQAEADPTGAVAFKPEGSDPVFVYDPGFGDSTYIDFGLLSLPNSLPINTPVVDSYAVAGFGLDWFSGDGSRLRLSISNVDILVNRGVLFLTAEATVTDQSLPAGFVLGDVVSVSYSATQPAIQLAGSTTTMAATSGVMTISGLLVVPEPAALLFVAMAVAGVAFQRSSRR